jgi:hypothetical protein
MPSVRRDVLPVPIPMITRPGARAFKVAKLQAVTGAISGTRIRNIGTKLDGSSVGRAQGQTLKGVGPDHLGIGYPRVTEAVGLGKGNILPAIYTC